jgi:hypothetical protein
MNHDTRPEYAAAMKSVLSRMTATELLEIPGMPELLEMRLHAEIEAEIAEDAAWWADLPITINDLRREAADKAKFLGMQTTEIRTQWSREQLINFLKDLKEA